VYADWLAEAGSELCAQVTEDHGPEQQARYLGPLARLWHEGELELSWRHGHVVRATLRRLHEYLAPRPEVIVGLLLEAPAFRFLQSLEVDLSVQAEVRPGAREKFALALVRTVAKSWGAPGLKSFTLGPATVWKPTAPLIHALETLAKRRPSITQAASSMVRRMEGAALELAGHPPEVRVDARPGQRFELPLDGVGLVAPRNNALVKLLPSKSVQPFAEAFLVQHLRDVWSVVPPGPETFLLCTQLKVNGQKRRAQCLRHGDSIELWPGLEFRFVEAQR
jgi:hypothetical protein